MVQIPRLEVSWERLPYLDAFDIVTLLTQGCQCRHYLQGSRGSWIPKAIRRGLLLDIWEEDQSDPWRLCEVGQWGDTGGPPWPVPVVSELSCDHCS